MARKSYVVDLSEAAAVISDMLLEYGDEISEDVTEAVKDTATYAQTMVARLSPRSNGSGGSLGHYADGWQVETTPLYGKVEAEIYQARKPQIAHLLEKGHLKRGGNGRVRGIPHIEPTQQSANAHLVTSVIQRITK